MLRILTLLISPLLAATSLPQAGDPIVPDWADLLEAQPSSRVIRDKDWRARIKSSGYAWRVRDRRSGIEMLLVPAGTYLRGASLDQKRPPTEELPRHEVTISRPFYLGRYEVQEHEWDHILSGEPLSRKNGLPVVNRSYVDVTAFLRRVNDSGDATVSAMRVPTEGEWEYACRAGTEGPHYGKSLSKVAWFRGNSGSKPQIVGLKAANPLGFHDMLGNAKEWCSDFYDVAEYERVAGSSELSVDPLGSSNKSKGRTLRGGAFSGPEHRVTASARSRKTSGKNKPYGFRVVRNP
jgi:formylglycine-generating enzyme required for sulfatase activity